VSLLFAAAATLADSFSQQENPLNPAGPGAQRISDLFYIILVPAMLVCLLVGGAIIYAAIRFREKPGGPTPKQVGGNNALEFTWTLVPGIILVTIFVLTIFQLAFIRSVPAAAQVPGALSVKVIGRQWAWSFQYPTPPGAKRPIISFAKMYIPAGQVVKVDIVSVDVIHSFAVPRLTGKLDAIPGKTNTQWIEAYDPGTYYGQCTEFCGLSHARMTLEVDALTPSEFQAWYAKQAGGK